MNKEEFRSRHTEVFSLGRHPKEFFVQRYGAGHFRLIGNSYFVFVDGCWVAVDVDGFTYTERVICPGETDFVGLLISASFAQHKSAPLKCGALFFVFTRTSAQRKRPISLAHRNGRESRRDRGKWRLRPLHVTLIPVFRRRETQSFSGRLF